MANNDLQHNSRVGLTVAWQVAPQHGLRLAASRGAFTSIGPDNRPNRSKEQPEPEVGLLPGKSQLP